MTSFNATESHAVDVHLQAFSFSYGYEWNCTQDIASRIASIHTSILQRQATVTTEAGMGADHEVQDLSLQMISQILKKQPD